MRAQKYIIPEGPVVRGQARLGALALCAARGTAQTPEHFLVRIGLIFLHFPPRSCNEYRPTNIQCRRDLVLVLTCTLKCIKVNVHFYILLMLNHIDKVPATFHENSIETHPVLTAAVKPLPTLAHICALRPTGAHAVHSVARSLMHALKRKKREPLIPIISDGISECRQTLGRLLV